MNDLKYRAVPGAAFDDETADKIGRLIERECGEAPDLGQVVDLALEPTSPLHVYLEWDNKTAALEYRKIQAAEVINCLLTRDETGHWVRAFRCITVTRTEAVESRPVYVSLDRSAAYQDSAISEASYSPPQNWRELGIRYDCVLLGTDWYRGEFDATWVEELSMLPIERISSENAMIFIRTGGSQIAAERAATILMDWSYKRIDDPLYLFGTVNRKGEWFERKIEQVVVGVRGRPSWPANKPSGVVQCAPDGIHELVESLTPFAKTRLYLYGDESPEGWELWNSVKESMAA